MNNWNQLVELLANNAQPPSELADLTVYRIRSTSPEGGFRAGESWFLAPCLCQEEAQALVASLSYPHRRHGDLFPLPNNELEVLPTPLPEVLADVESRQDLLGRLKSLTPYRDQVLPEGGEWVWCFQAQEHWHLWLQGGRLHFPPDWAVDRDFGRIGPLEAHRGYLQVANQHGLFGLSNGEGEMLLPCRYRWLGNVGFRLPLLEAQEANSPADESDLIDLSGHRLNPPGIKLLAGSFDTDDQPVVVREGTGESGRKGLMDTAGQLLGDIRWRWIKAISEGLAAVQDDDSGLWGYVDACGQPAISCQFHEAHTFNDQRAYASLSPTTDETPCFGLIDPHGQWVISPVWKDISYLRHDYIVEDFAGRYGVIDRNGQILLEPRHLTIEEKGNGQGFDARRDIRYTLQLDLNSHARNREARQRIEADPQRRLAGLTHLFNRRTDQRDLINAGLWGMTVSIVEDNHWQGHDFKAGDTGTIFWQYPVSASLFDFSLEAPVMGLFGLDEQCLGVPWAALQAI